ncbi:P-loop containing nucleoside triphosphate hydrolase protein [Cylindrobasidium torrendii FP15055 ss-10]|uniref:p-loop containing nucleoside triphosphate hydrolase protein n=1 Tax=Cylindrobasidium torrendii FP15055 ss-10 TaxID=1314674 RepID=A0A0D7AXW1_9AGAR|nr:P-loop containing nucleoside triphosphate hydrolase protein [Cylindrobasidium torrendii FP15055 ss-10]
MPATDDATVPKWDWRARYRSGKAIEATKKGPKRMQPQNQPLLPDEKWHDEALRYREHFLDMIEAERVEDEAIFRQRLSTWDTQRLVDEGYTLTDLSAFWADQKSLNSRVPKTLSFQLGPGIVLPENRFENGTQVLISRLDPLKEIPLRGSVVSSTNSHIRVGLDEAKVDVDGAWRLDVTGSNTSYDRMSLAVKTLGNRPSLGNTRNADQDLACLGTELTDVILPGFSHERPSPGVVEREGIFKDDMRIMSWARRYSRADPLVMPGDPTLDTLNSTQRCAVALMLKERFSLIQGPPGTGKTKTLVEAVKLLKQHFAVPYPILVCTYTNVAVDHLVEGMGRGGLRPLRVASSGKSTPELAEYSIDTQLSRHPLAADTQKLEESSRAAQEAFLSYQTQIGLNPTARQQKTLNAKKNRSAVLDARLWSRRRDMARDVIKAADVICTTCISAGSPLLSIADFPLVFLDEASMSTEPSSLVPLVKGSRHVALIGDHKQLPPIITSPDAKALGLGVSLFERLIEEGRVPSIMLDIQYRMHPSISAFPSLEFYDLGLQDGIQGQEPLNGMHKSVVFIDHSGAESLRDRSRVNWNEAHIIMSVLEELLASNPNLTGHDVGIIAPYVAQISLLTRLLNVDKQYAARFERSLGHKALQLKHVEIKTVDGFEGREKEVIIFSTVRNNSHGNIGFLADRGRLNVGLTRAKRGLVVVGSIDTLRTGRKGHSQGVLEEGQKESNAAWRQGGADSWKRYVEFCAREGLVVKPKAYHKSFFQTST